MKKFLGILASLVLGLNTFAQNAGQDISFYLTGSDTGVTNMVYTFTNNNSNPFYIEYADVLFHGVNSAGMTNAFIIKQLRPIWYQGLAPYINTNVITYWWHTNTLISDTRSTTATDGVYNAWYKVDLSTNKSWVIEDDIIQVSISDVSTNMFKFIRLHTSHSAK